MKRRSLLRSSDAAIGASALLEHEPGSGGGSGDGNGSFGCSESRTA
ncbi:hypothetical protein [Streptomyces sp. NBC_00459]